MVLAHHTLKRIFGWSFKIFQALTFPKWCVGGDFNVIRRILEKLGGARLTSSIMDFDNLVKECQLIDPPLRNPSFTWSNLQENPVCKRRFLFSRELEKGFPQCIQEALPILTSDHCPIVFYISIIVSGG